MGCSGFKFLEHMADVYFVAVGRTIEEAFCNAARAMFETITDTSKVEVSMCLDVNDSCYDMFNCVYRWLEDLLILHDTHNLVFKDFEFKFLEHGGEDYRFIGKACGEVFNPDKHVPRTVVKAVTYSLMNIEHVNDCWKIYVVLDI